MDEQEAGLLAAGSGVSEQTLNKTFLKVLHLPDTRQSDMQMSYHEFLEVGVCAAARWSAARLSSHCELVMRAAVPGRDLGAQDPGPVPAAGEQARELFGVLPTAAAAQTRPKAGHDRVNARAHNKIGKMLALD